MSDTPRSDAECYSCMDTCSEWNGEWVPLKVARQLERELTEAKHRIRTLIEERDSARIQADHKWRLREEFEALLGTSDMETGVERVKELKRALSFTVPKCDHLHHPKKYQHKITEPCPVEELIRKAQKI